ncbi:MAG: glycosyltransferase [Thermoplasmata archaeon]|nr:glycosyltransferase [Thermoplasmata archaeon]
MILDGGMAAYNEERNIESALRSLLDQTLPPGVRWGKVWVVASGCTDRTVEIAERISAEDPRVEVVVEPERRGKVRALHEIFRRTRGDLVVLLNSDAGAQAGAVSELIRAASGLRPPFAVMGRPIVVQEQPGLVGRAVGLLWALHHESHLERLRRIEIVHLSDELLLVSGVGLPEIPGGVISEGNFIGAWLARRNADRSYAPTAQAAVQLPLSLRDHLLQRRRILYGHHQVASLLGVPPGTFPRFFLQHPGPGVRLLGRTLRARRHGLLDLLLLSGAEVLALALAGWDRILPAREQVLWERIRQPMLHPHGSDR